MSKVLFLLRRRQDYDADPTYSSSYQIATGMFNSAQFVVDELVKSGIDAAVEIAVDANDIDRIVTKHQPRHVFIEGLWVTPAKFTELKSIKRHRNVNWVVRIHSEIPFLATEGVAMDWIVQYLDLGVKVAPNAPRAHEQLTWLVETRRGTDLAKALVPYLPNCFPTNFDDYPVQMHSRRKDLDIACFGAFRPMKNHLQQAFVALKYAQSKGKNLRFHINTRYDHGGSSPARNVTALIEAAGQTVVEHTWEDRDTFLKSLQSVDLLLQLSMSETFNIVAADAVLVGTPILVSKEISWAYPTYGDPQSVADCLKKLNVIMQDKKFFLNGNRTGLSIYASASAKRWLAYLETA